MFFANIDHGFKNYRTYSAKGIKAMACGAVVLHMPTDSPSQLPAIIQRAAVMPAGRAEDGETIQHGKIYIAPPDFHLLVERGRVRVEVICDIRGLLISQIGS